MKKSLSILLIAMLVITASLPAFAVSELNGVAAQIAEGHGDSAYDPIVIGSVDDWNAFDEFLKGDETSGAGRYFVLGADIGSEKSRVGICIDTFCGTLDGQDHKIYASIDAKADAGEASLFINCKGAIICNITVFGAIAGSSAAAVCCNAENTMFINCTNRAGVTGEDKAAGICCVCRQNCNFSNCLNNGTVSAKNSVGGIACDASSCTFSNCVNNVAPESEDLSAVIVGNGTSSFANCYIANEGGWALSTDGKTASGKAISSAEKLLEALNEYITENRKTGIWKPWTAEMLNNCPHNAFDKGVCIDCGWVCPHDEHDENYFCLTCGIFEEETVKKELDILTKNKDDLEGRLSDVKARSTELENLLTQYAINPKTSSVVSGGNIWMVLDVGIVAVVGIAAYVILRKKKLLSGAEESETKEVIQTWNRDE